ncbi:MAG: hypothetical protein GY865_12585 [candidate division Zixibacteria bacterium]|nr:hypothetical protein [candidate division Zixibacteria bacterium]
MRLTFLIFIFLMIFGSGLCLADEVEKINTEIIQKKMDRFYFATGVEENIFQDCSYIIIKSNDTLYKGLIEASYPGVSYSYQIDNISDTINIDSFVAYIQPAAIDSLTPIKIGILKSIPYGSLSNFPGIISVTLSSDSARIGESKYGNILHTHHYDSEMKMLWDFEAGIIDAYISYNAENRSHIGQTSISTPAPFYVAMIPNISKPVNNKAFLTTSLYYRFNAERISTLFDGDNVTVQNCLFPCLRKFKRMYEYNPENGRNLLNYMDKKPKKIFIKLQNESLEKLGQYFADVLSRDRIKTRFTEDNDKADINLKFVSLYDPFYSILTFIESDLLEYKDTNNTFLELLDILEYYKTVTYMTSQIYLPERVQRPLIEDIGVFPLLRPSLFFRSSDNLKGFAFDNNGLMDLSNLRKVILPQKIAGADR